MTVCLRNAAYLLCSLGLALLPLHARGNGLVGTSVTGSLYFTGNPNNYFDPGNGYVPSSGYENTSSTTVMIASPAVEFGFADATNTDLANFSATQFTIEDVLSSTAGGSDYPFTMTFTDTAFLGQTFTQVSDSFPAALTGALVGDTFTVKWAGGSVVANDDFTSTFVVGTAVPEPSSWALLLAGAGTLCALSGRRSSRRA